jgi:hypothetical protein
MRVTIPPKRYTAAVIFATPLSSSVRASSGSRPAIKAVELAMSANMTLTRRRSPTGAGLSKGAPHWAQ